MANVIFRGIYSLKSRIRRALADVYDALSTNRPYRTAPEEALQVMDDEAKLELWDESLFASFHDMIRESRPVKTAASDVRKATK